MNPAHCPDSPNPRHHHGVYASDRYEDGNWAYGKCAHCHRHVRGDLRTYALWETIPCIIQEDPI